MTKDELMEMEAGQELNALVAEKVMGWIPQEIEDTGEVAWLERREGFEEFQWTGNLSGLVYGFTGDINVRLDDGGILTAHLAGDVWRPSAWISHAWEVVMRMYKEGYTIDIHSDTQRVGDDWVVCLGTSSLPMICVGDEPEVAICKAAIIAVMEWE